MKTFGHKTQIFQLMLLCFNIAVMVMIRMVGGNPLGISWLLIIAILPLLNNAVIRIGNSRLRITRLFPVVVRNVNVELADVTKIMVETGMVMRIAVHMKDGRVLNTHINRYSIDMRPLYLALKETGIPIESHGVDALDWV